MESWALDPLPTCILLSLPARAPGVSSSVAVLQCQLFTFSFTFTFRASCAEEANHSPLTTARGEPGDLIVDACGSQDRAWHRAGAWKLLFLLSVATVIAGMTVRLSALGSGWPPVELGTLALAAWAISEWPHPCLPSSIGLPDPHSEFVSFFPI